MIGKALPWRKLIKAIKPVKVTSNPLRGFPLSIYVRKSSPAWELVEENPENMNRRLQLILQIERGLFFEIKDRT